jgi:hypothetical protein
VCGFGARRLGADSAYHVAEYANQESAMDETPSREKFDTGMKKIRLEIKSRLVHHGLFGTITGVDSGAAGSVPDGSRIEVAAKGRTVGRSFDRKQIEDSCLRVSGEVLLSIIAMVDEVSATPRDDSANTIIERG